MTLILLSEGLSAPSTGHTGPSHNSTYSTGAPSCRSKPLLLPVTPVFTQEGVSHDSSSHPRIPVTPVPSPTLSPLTPVAPIMAIITQKVPVTPVPPHDSY